MGLHEVPFDRERAMVAGELAAALEPLILDAELRRAQGRQFR